MLKTLPITPEPKGVERFWSHVEKRGPDECWPWTGAERGRGYGAFQLQRRRTALAHRYAYAASNGSLPAGLVVCHSCDNPCCCNPAHLKAGSQQDNIRDCWRKGRASFNAKPRRGAENNQSKLTEAGVRLIRSTPRGVPLARMLGVSFAAISAVRRGLTWRHVEGGV